MHPYICIRFIILLAFCQVLFPALLRYTFLVENKTKKLPKIIAVVGPTSSGKSDLAVDIALQFNGEIISADSRQVYRGLDIATGKITREETRGIPHHLLDIADPQERYTVSHFKRDAENAIDDILSRSKIPVICGGTMQYVNAVVQNMITPKIPPNEILRRELSQRTPDELFEELKKLDPKRAESIDSKNPRRLVRAIEIAKTLGAVPDFPDVPKKYDVLEIGISTDKEVLRNRISKRTEKRIKDGMVEEARTLHNNGLSYERMKELGLEYKYLAQYLEGKITEEKMTEEINFKDRQYARRQMTWLKRDKKIHWFPLTEKQCIFETISKHLEMPFRAVS